MHCTILFVCLKGPYNGEFQIFGIKLYEAIIMADYHFFLLTSPRLIEVCNGIKGGLYIEGLSYIGGDP